MIKALVFDMGGVLLRTHDYGGRHKWDDRLGLPRGSVESVVFGTDVHHRAEVGEGTMDDVWRAAGARLGIDEAQLEEFREDFWSGDRLDRELLGYLAGLRGRYKLGLLSNAWNTLRPILDTRLAPLGTSFDVIVISAEEGVRKPDPRIYRRVLDLLGVEPAEAVFVDDVPANVEGARAVGMHALQFTTTPEVIAGLEQLGVR